MPLWHRRVYQTNRPTDELWTKSKTQLSEGSAGQLQIGRNQEGGDTGKHQGVDFAFFYSCFHLRADLRECPTGQPTLGQKPTIFPMRNQKTEFLVTTATEWMGLREPPGSLVPDTLWKR